MKYCLSQRGASAVEFALILPLLLAILFGIIEFSVLMYDKQMITNASREGARHGIVFHADSDGNYAPLTNDAITGVVTNYLQNNLISFDADSFSVSINPTTRVREQPLTVTVNYRYSFLVLPNLQALISSGSAPPWSLPLNATTVMRME
jgi:Flp pilus assembly protein TadG